MPKLEYYIPVGRQRLRCGYTTGTCAAAAARGAAQALLTGVRPAGVEIDTPAGVRVRVELLDWSAGVDWAMCAVEKDGGDDPDVTDGMRIYARVSRRGDGALRVDGGEGVGRVTRPGLDQPPGAAAINSTPRRMIAGQLAEALREAGASGGLEAVISVPGGAALARKTFNPRLGIQGGISILGTSGIVRPMSEAALVDSITLELDMAHAAGVRHLLVTPGNYGEDYARDHLGLETGGCISCSNYLGAAVDHAAGLGFSSFLLVGHLGKLVKVAGGAMNTHSRTADGRRETMAAHAALCGAPRKLVEQVFAAATTDAALDCLEEAGLREDVTASLTGALYENLRNRAGEEMEIQAVVFSNRFGLLGQTPGAAKLLARHRRGEGESL
ncbi:MAG: cobalamin biosynthesis protein CbiD [Clostridiales bacterium]|nr:cobalamin biosynthesis protein CbiD [Clostridiales bacterium]